MKKYSTTIRINNIGFYQLLKDIEKGSISMAEFKEVDKLLTKEQRQELIDNLWDIAISRLLDKDDVNVYDFLEPQEVDIYKYLTIDRVEDLPF
jgi:hypothetical protein